ncbi:septum site-determining protein MinC [Parathermosynechococcus lividus]|uniref:septum site-determining protein MinC n=1 Tax=Parathermosynechococcus lividus TaxID=33070 RepID=UPI000C18F90E|nr:septum site-determining protein MinC [Thermostichus lividus]MCH9054638.1 septum site-determining protein MinC [Synechococcus sp. PCC 6716]
MSEIASTPTPEHQEPVVPDLTETPDTFAGLEPAQLPEIGLEYAQECLKMTLPAHLEWVDLWPQIQIRLDSQEPLWAGMLAVECHCGQRLMDQSQIQQLAEALGEKRLQLVQVITERRQTAIAAATLGYSVQQGAPPVPPLIAATTDEEAAVSPLYLKTTLRSGMEICHGASVIVLGDVNAGASVIAAGDIIIWGRLRGVAHAGAKGNSRAWIMTLEMAATQLRIADFVARTPEPPSPPYPEVAYATDQGIQIAPALHMLRSSAFHATDLG